MPSPLWRRQSRSHFGHEDGLALQTIGGFDVRQPAGVQSCAPTISFFKVPYLVSLSARVKKIPGSINSPKTTKM